jgi:hypothetical protein
LLLPRFAAVAATATGVVPAAIRCCSSDSLMLLPPYHC